MTVTTEASVQAQRYKQGPFSNSSSKNTLPSLPVISALSSSHLMQIIVAIRIFFLQEHFEVLATVLRFFSPLRNVKSIKTSYKPRIGLFFFF